MKSKAFVLAIVCAVITYTLYTAAQHRKAAEPRPADSEIPKAEIKTIDVPDSIEWDFMLGRTHPANPVRGKVLWIDGKEVRLEKEGGAIRKIAIDKFCTADRELLKAAYEAESEMQSEQTDSEKFRKDVEKLLRFLR